MMGTPDTTAWPTGVILPFASWSNACDGRAWPRDTADECHGGGDSSERKDEAYARTDSFPRYFSYKGSSEIR
ncbi:hypothetical protein FGB62_63g021 [Gracilaria domingensis]|nr:hypothetical protein FGB62_63g021 [Gracilaria domingensis]